MSRRRSLIWGMAAVVVLAVAGTTTALLSGGDDSDYKSLPTCDGLASALPGKPALTVAQNVTDPEDFRGLHPAYTNIECRTADTQVFVEMYQPSNVDLIYMRQYTDHTVHDGRWRANDMFTRRTKGYEQLSANVRFSAAGPSAYSCTVTTLKRNATVDLTVPLASVTSIEEWRTACRQIAKSQMPKVVDAALG